MKSWIPLLAALSGIALSGCIVDVADGYADDAVYTVEWRIDGSGHPAACRDFDAAFVYVTIESRAGTEDYATVPCEDFGVDFYLLPGRYWVTVTMLDRARFDISSTVQTDPITLRAGDGDYVVADFPPDSFL
jgi:hypothetical protein